MMRHPCKVTTELPPHAGNAADKATPIQKGKNPVESRVYFSALAERESASIVFIAGNVWDALNPNKRIF